MNDYEKLKHKVEKWIIKYDNEAAVLSVILLAIIIAGMTYAINH